MKTEYTHIPIQTVLQPYLSARSSYVMLYRNTIMKYRNITQHTSILHSYMYKNTLTVK